METTADGQRTVRFSELEFRGGVRLTALRHHDKPGGQLAIRQQMGDGTLTGHLFELSDEQCRALIEALREDNDAE